MSYLSRAEFLDQSIPQDVITGLTDQQIEDALSWASRIADMYIGKAHELPLISWDEDLKALVGDLAQYRLLSRRGFRPQSGNDQIAVKRHDDAVKVLEAIAKGTVRLANVVDSTESVDEDGPLMVEGENRPFTFNTGSRRGYCCESD